MATRSQLISYLRDCYRSDNRESSLANLLHSRNRHVRFFEGDEVGISGTIEKIPLPEKVAKTVQKDAFQYRRDKSLVYAVFPVVGTRRELSSLGKVLCAPLAFFPAEISESEKGWFLTPEFDEITWNYPVLSSIAALDGADDSALSKSLNQLGTPPWPKEQVHTLAALFADLLPSIEFEQLAQFPDLVDKHTVESFLAKQKLRCVPAAAMALLPNSPNTRGVLYELETLADEKEHSPPLVALLDDDYTSQPRIRAARCAAPTTLSSAQQHVANICRSLPISLVIGPPGTGKSHTIASVAVDHLANAQSVLVACQTDQAVDVVGEKIDELLGETAGVVRAGRKKYARKLNSHLASLLQDSIDNPRSEERL